MRLPKYFCPECKRFKERTDTLKSFVYERNSQEGAFEGFARICDHCGHSVKLTEDIIEQIIKVYCLFKEKE